MAVEVGQVVQGEVTGITNFGAFVQLPENQSGLVHISEISAGFVKEVSDYLSVGDTVQVKVLKVTPDGKINLSIRQANPEEDSASANRQPQQKFYSNERSGRPQNRRGNFEDKVAHEREVKNTLAAPTSQSKSRTDAGDSSFDSLMSAFLKDSEDRLASLRRNTEGKRGGRGGRRN